jgi:hypothetical protein
VHPSCIWLPAVVLYKKRPPSNPDKQFDFGSEHVHGWLPQPCDDAKIPTLPARSGTGFQLKYVVRSRCVCLPPWCSAWPASTSHRAGITTASSHSPAHGAALLGADRLVAGMRPASAAYIISTDVHLMQRSLFAVHCEHIRASVAPHRCARTCKSHNGCSQEK